MNSQEIYRKHVLILGASGFIGRHLATRLRCEKSLSVYEHKGRQECDLIHADQASGLIQRVNPDIIFHLAALPDLSTDDVFAHNVTITKNILSSLKFEHPVTLIHIGSYKQYGNSEIPFVENMPLKPCNPYSKSKAVSEDLIREYGETHKYAHSILLRVGPVIGRSQPQYTFVPTVINAVSKGFGNNIKVADTVWDPTSVEDICEALLATIYCELALNTTINLSYGMARSPVTVAKTIASIMGYHIEPIIIRDCVYSCLGKCELAKRLLCWQAFQDIDSTLKNIIAHHCCPVNF